MNPRSIVFLLCALSGPAFALAQDAPVRVPVTVEEYDASRGPDVKTVAPQSVRLHNIRRILDPDLPVAQRMASLRLVEKLGPDDPSLLEALKAVAADPKTPAELQQAASQHVLLKAVPADAVRTLATLPPGNPLRRAILMQLARSGDAAMYADVVKAWAQEAADGADEQQFRGAVEKIATQPWDQALIAAINSESFFARGSAMKVLAGRFTPAGLAAKLASVPARTEAMAALKAFVTQLGYMPKDGPDLVSVVSIYRLQPNSFPDVARLGRQWKAEPGGYDFNIRDFHLLSRLTADPLRKALKREQLVAAITASLAGRQHVTRAGAPEGSDGFAKQAAALPMADLWNLYLLDGMLTRPRVLLALHVMADRDRADTRTAWGGLIVYESGGAEARLYPPDKDAPPNDLKYVPSKQMIAEGRDSMCRFMAHFEKAANASRAGPTAEELAAAAEGNYYGLVLTTVSENELCAHYFSPQGVVVSLGRVALKF
jgi:hypothetical protein